MFDLSGNQSIADEAVFLTAFVGAIATLAGIWFQSKRTRRTVDRIDDTLNHVGKVEPLSGPTIGQRVARIDVRVDRLEGKIDGLHDDVRVLSRAMIDHIGDEGRRIERLERVTAQLDRRSEV